MSIEKSKIELKDSKGNITVLLEENEQFQLVEYKVLQNSSIVLPCTKILYNGKIMLLYRKKEYLSLSMAYAIDKLLPEQMLELISNYLLSIIKIGENGYLSLENINVDINYIYFNASDLSVNLMYLPLKEHLFESVEKFENYVISSVNYILSKYKYKDLVLIQKITDIIQKDLVTIKEIYQQLIVLKGSSSDETTIEPESKEATLVLTGLYEAMGEVIRINTTDFVIGKSEEGTDYCIKQSKFVGRRHCKIIKENNLYFVVDLQSTNGVFIDDEKVTKRQLVKNQKLRLANLIFQVSFE